jgi:hypothetical protein
MVEVIGEPGFENFKARLVNTVRTPWGTDLAVVEDADGEWFVVDLEHVFPVNQ